jgi:hypothetical protein
VQPPQSTSRIDDAFAAIDRKAMHTKARPLKYVEPKDWLLWADVTGIDRWGSTAAPLLYGHQVNALIGLTHRVAPTLLVGVLSGYEIFDYRSDALDGHLKGSGWTLGSYLGWKFLPGLRSTCRQNIPESFTTAPQVRPQAPSADIAGLLLAV